jgi:hypothetical protein
MLRSNCLELRFATIIDARGGIRHPRTVGEGGKEIGEICVAALGDEPRHGVACAPAARLSQSGAGTALGGRSG